MEDALKNIGQKEKYEETIFKIQDREVVFKNAIKAGVVSTKKRKSLEQYIEVELTGCR